MELTALGEILIDFTPLPDTAAGMAAFERNPGGAPANVACCGAGLGTQTAFIGKIGRDIHGAFLKKVLAERGVCTDGLIETDQCFTTLAFVELSRQGERAFSFARKPGADTQLREDELDRSLLESTKVLAVGSLSLTDEPARSATFAAIRMAKEAGAVIAYDPNYRASLWPSREAAILHLRSLLPYVDVIKLSDEETELLTGEADPAAALALLEKAGIPAAAVTLGRDGALVRVGGDTAHVPGFACKAVDTTGAGDAFWGGFLSAYIRSGKSIRSLTLEEAKSCARFGNAAAALCVQKRGAIPAMPSRAEVLKLLDE